MPGRGNGGGWGGGYPGTGGRGAWQGTWVHAVAPYLQVKEGGFVTGQEEQDRDPARDV